MTQKPKPQKCPHNEWVSCMTPKKCASCGWAPEVAARRKEANRKRLGVAEKQNEEERE